MTFIIFLVLVSVIAANLEIQIEGKDGWAGKLPTWRMKNKIVSFFFGQYELTGYTLYMNLFVLCFLHFPFVFDLYWNLASELRVLSFFLFFWLLEDFLWFVFNPHYGIKKFNKGNISWHQSWFLGLPTPYYKFFFGGLLLLVASYLI